jgi:tetratricopeptide (TPR) repeat protein
MEASDWLTDAEHRRQCGDEAGALDAFKRAAESARAAFDPAGEGRAMLGVGEMRLLLADDAGARRAFEEAIARAVEGGAPDVEAEAWFRLATAFFDAGRSKDGHDALLESMALLRQMADDAPDDAAVKARLARAIRVYGEHLAVLGTESDARQALEIARLMYVDLGETQVAAAIDADVRRLGDWAR